MRRSSLRRPPADNIFDDVGDVDHADADADDADAKVFSERSKLQGKALRSILPLSDNKIRIIILILRLNHMDSPLI